MNSQTSVTEPDQDAIKMFVGQIPRYMNESDLQKIFDEFGPIYQLNVLRDKATGDSKGCCFITFYTRRAALEAQNVLHNIKTLPGMQHPVQMKPADSEKRVEDRKLFVGMLSKRCSENDVRHLFSPFGTIEECTVLREQNGQSKGCAFITFTSKQCAMNAIRNLHHSRTLEGCRSPLVVKLADSQKEKEMKRLQQMQAQLLNNPNINAFSQQYLNLLQQSAAAGNGGSLGNFGSLGLGLNAMQIQQLLTAAASGSNGGSLHSTQGDVGGAMQNLHNLAALAALAGGHGGSGLNSMSSLQNALPSVGGAAGGSGGNSHPPTMASAFSNGSGGFSNSSNGFQNGSSGFTNGSNGYTNGSSGLNNGSGMGGQIGVEGGATAQSYTNFQQQYAGLSNLFNPGAFGGNAFSNQMGGQSCVGGTSSLVGGVNGNSLTAAAGVQNSPAGKQTEGPDGANLFIYHLPQEYTDHDLLQMFQPFGNVISSKIFIDKQTNLSKCFGFVSFDNCVSAQNAIQAMNGYQIGTKRLKVQLKRPKSEGGMF